MLLKGDPDRLYQRISSLTDNAVKFTEKGTVFLQVSKKEEKKTILHLFLKSHLKNKLRLKFKILQNNT